MSRCAIGHDLTLEGALVPKIRTEGMTCSKCRLSNKLPSTIARRKEWYEKNKATQAEYNRVRRANDAAVERGLVADLTIEQWTEIVDEYEDSCAYCLEHKSKAIIHTTTGATGLTLDHVIPLSEGGGTTRVNVVPACFACNLAKTTEGWTPSIASRLWPFENTLIEVKKALA